MCSYCGCESRAVLVDLMSEHASIAYLAQQAVCALAAGEVTSAVLRCGEIARLFAAHGAKEEAGLFAEWRAAGLDADAIERLESDHRGLRSGLAALAAGDTGRLRQVLDNLLEHANREDSDLFPAALQLLPDHAWARVQGRVKGP